MSSARLALAPSLTAALGAPEVRVPEQRDARVSRLVRESFDGVWRLLRRLGVPAATAEDAAQEVFLVAARRIDQITPGSEKSYLYGTALRIAAGARRKNAREASRTRALDGAEPASGRSPEELLDERRRLELLDAVLAELDDDERGVFVLFELEGLSLTEIAELVDIPRGTVASRLRRARARFVRLLRSQSGRGRNG